MGYIHTMNIFLAIKRNKGLLHDGMTWTNLENIMQSKRSQFQKATYCMIAFIQNAQTGKFRKQIRGCQGPRQARNEQGLLGGMGFLSGMMTMSWSERVTTAA